MSLFIYEQYVVFLCKTDFVLFPWKKQKFYDIDDAGKNWFLITAARKWKEFKATLKEQYFDENLTDEELKKRHGDRVNDEDWNFLVNYWKSPECDVWLILLYTYITCIVQYLCIM